MSKPKRVDTLISLRMPEKTKHHHLFRQEKSPIVDIDYPSITKTRRFNNQKDLETKTSQANKIYHKILANRHSPRAVTQLQTELRILRPPLKLLQSLYLSKGLSSKEVSMIVNYKTYNTLPQVKITKQQYDLLAQLLEGKELSPEHNSILGLTS